MQREGESHSAEPAVGISTRPSLAALSLLRPLSKARHAQIMASLVAGFARLASLAVGTLSGRRGMTLWYGLLAVRLVALIVADRPWATLREDFICNGSADNLCWAECFNARFDFPANVLWDFSYLLAILPVLCLYQLAPHRPRPPALPEQAPGRLVLEESGAVGGRPWASIACALLLAATEGAFLWVLVQVQLPLAVPEAAPCLLPACSGPQLCILRAQAEKLGALAVLGFASGLDVLVSLVYAAAACLTARGRHV